MNRRYIDSHGWHFIRSFDVALHGIAQELGVRKEITGHGQSVIV